MGGMGRMMTAARMGTSAVGMGDGPRPMTSIKGAGFQSKPGTSAGRTAAGFDPLSQKPVGPAPALADKADNSPEDQAKEMEKKVGGRVLPVGLLS
jgi:hypothetical protein